MSGIQKPTDFGVLLKKHGVDVFELMSTYKAVDDKGRYLHWHEFKRRVPAGINKEAAWAAVKIARASGNKALDLNSECGQPFQLHITDFCHTVIHDIEQLNARLGGQAAPSSGHGENNKYLVDSLMMEEAISSAQLEGAATTRKVAKEMLVKELPPQNDDERMILNNYLLMKHAKFNKDEALSLELICEFHKIATVGVKDDEVNPGQVRDDDDIFVGGRDGEVAHQPPKAELLLDRIEALCNFANELHDGKDGRYFIHPVVKAIILHFMIGYEHPFRDGNGRTARCLFYWYMLKSGYWPFEYISISALLKEAPIQYGQSYLFTETDSFDLTYFVIYQLRIIERAINEFIEYFEAKKREFYELMHWLDERGISKRLNYRQGHLLKKVVRNPGRVFTAKELTHDYDVSENTARKDLEKLAEMKALAKIQEGKGYLYVSRSDAAENLKKVKVDLKDLLKVTTLGRLE
ncbi:MULTISPECIES: Fic family protein [Pseudomonas]|uniref:Fic family protein n=1 Tax=Pseudomonas TaxID=286 RepID=UPI0018E78C27|nr:MULTISPECIES: Fic family protein [Pseudomonas]MBJ2345532.1 Fic family protein [Pseudomonas canavaninivorans]MBL3544704.1 Fic family protein [Pseudomonas sp. HB05]